jgi:hypothetical protein
VASIRDQHLTRPQHRRSSLLSSLRLLRFLMFKTAARFRNCLGPLSSPCSIRQSSGPNFCAPQPPDIPSAKNSASPFIAPKTQPHLLQRFPSIDPSQNPPNFCALTPMCFFRAPAPRIQPAFHLQPTATTRGAFLYQNPPKLCAYPEQKQYSTSRRRPRRPPNVSRETSATRTLDRQWRTTASQHHSPLTVCTPRHPST